MKKLFIFLLTVSFIGLSAQQKGKDYRNIMQSKNIYEINAFLRDAHPDDPRRVVLKPRVMGMMQDYIKNAADPNDKKVKEMQENLATLKRKPSTKITFEEYNDKIKQKQIAKYRTILANKQVPNYVKSNPQNVYVTQTATTVKTVAIADTEAEEFNMLMGMTSAEHTDKTVKILNSLFDNDPNAKDVIVMIENKSDCNIIVRMEGIGNTKFRLAVPAHDDNSLVVPKGNYLFTSIVCGAQYASQKTLQKPLKVALGSSK